MLQRACYILASSLIVSLAFGLQGTPILDAAGHLKTLPSSIATSNSDVVTIVTSPGSTSLLSTDTSNSLVIESEDPPVFSCPGATLGPLSKATAQALTLTARVSRVILVDGITEGDVQSGWSHSRHVKTLDALFRARLSSSILPSSSSSVPPTKIYLCVRGDVSSEEEALLLEQIEAQFDAAVLETFSKKVDMDALFQVEVVSVTNDQQAQAVQEMAQTYLTENPSQNQTSLASSLELAQRTEPTTIGAAPSADTPLIAGARVALQSSFSQQARAARAKIASWKNRVARGLLVDGFGKQADLLRTSVLQRFDAETLSVVGLPSLAAQRLELRKELAALLDTNIRELFDSQVENLKRSTTKRMKARLLRLLNVPPQDAPTRNAAAMNAVMKLFHSKMDSLEVPSLGLVKSKACREMEASLNTEMLNFADSPTAQLKRKDKLAKVVEKPPKKEGERSFRVGMHFVAMVRPDGYGNLQGFCGYSVAGNSFTLGFHNDADDPLAISHFGGDRPPFLRVQPKLRFDIEL